MKVDTTFKEFVEERDINFFLLKFGTQEYRDLVEEFNAIKLRLEAEEEAREWEKVRERLSLR